MFLLSGHSNQANAEQSYDVSYRFDFYPKQNGNLDAKLTILLSSLRSDVYIEEFTLSIPNNFYSDKLIASIDTAGTDYKVESNKQGKRIIFEFEEPIDDLASNHKIELTYTHENLYTKGKFVDEIILPLVKGNENTETHVLLHIPKTELKDPSIIKPAASVVHDERIEWKNVRESSLYVQFGDYNMFDLDLSYELSNSKLSKSEQVIAFPPDTMHQKIFVAEIDPAPKRTWTDVDGNFLASYDVPSRGSIEINFKGTAQIFSAPRPETLESFADLFKRQQKHLLTEKNYWSLGSYYNEPDLEVLTDSKSIYDYIVSEFEYSESRLKNSPERRGAERALEKPYDAICTDFTDTFIALARENGIYAREIQGYGVSEKQNIRPLSLRQDILHSWAEYYSPDRNVWVQVDPTWAKTSGISYYDVFDTQHIALAIHGEDPSYPLPVGSYKENSKKDILVTETDNVPEDVTSLAVNHSITQDLVVNKSFSSSLEITNTGNTYLYDIDATLIGDNISLQDNQIHIDQIAPYETIAFNVQLTPKREGTQSISVLYEGKTLNETQISVVEASQLTFTYIIGLIVGIVILAGSFLIVRIARS